MKFIRDLKWILKNPDTDYRTVLIVIAGFVGLILLLAIINSIFGRKSDNNN